MTAVRAVAAALVLVSAPAQATPPNVITGAEYAEPTDRYDHGILGDALEWGALVLTVDMCAGCEAADVRKFTIRLPENRVFEDVAPRLVEVDGDGSPEVMVVETDVNLGARLALYDESGPIAATPFIGRSYRWLAPLGVADLDGDGRAEIAYVDRPHLAKIIRIWRYQEGSEALQPVADLPGYSNHRIGEPEISGGIRECGQGPEMIVADADWQSVYAVRYRAGRFATERLGDFRGPGSLDAALGCRAP